MIRVVDFPSIVDDYQGSRVTTGTHRRPRRRRSRLAKLSSGVFEDSHFDMNHERSNPYVLHRRRRLLARERRRWRFQCPTVSKCLSSTVRIRVCFSDRGVFDILTTLFDLSDFRSAFSPDRHTPLYLPGIFTSRFLSASDNRISFPSHVLDLAI
jgi:hypothetical protein